MDAHRNVQLRNVARVFPRRTKATPIDPLAFVGPPDLFPPDVDRVEISVTFTWDLPEAERLAEAWEKVAPVSIGGPATGQAGGDFLPGRYLRPGYTITSRGCPNRCWFCSVWKRESGIRELPITAGWIVQDDNLLACSECHVRKVFAMLARQRRRVQFTGGLEARRLEDWHVDLLASLKPRPVVFFSFDNRDDWEPLRVAARKLFEAGFTRQSHRVQCYVLIGYPGDELWTAEERLRATLDLGLTPMAMLWRGESGRTTQQWSAFQRQWARPALIHARGKGRSRNDAD